jgi:calcyphosin
MDDDGSGQLSFEEWRKAIKEHALPWSQRETRAVFDHFDADHSGSVSYDEFITVLRGEMNPRRTQLVLMAFDLLDTDKSGSLEVVDIVDKYDASRHPDVIQGRKTATEILREFLETFDSIEKDGKVSPDEFVK